MSGANPKYNVAGNLYMMSDPHFFHTNILLYDHRSEFYGLQDHALYEEYLANNKQRPNGRISDDAVDRMNAAIIKNINETIADPDRDTLLIAGDLVFGSQDNYASRAAWIMNQIKCEDVRICWGNHDEPDKIANLFTYCYDTITLQNMGKKFFFSHYPHVTGPELHKPGVMHCYGHVHGLYEKPHHPHPLARPHLWAAVDLCVVGNDYKPFTAQQIIDRTAPIFENRRKAKAVGQEHHYL